MCELEYVVSGSSPGLRDGVGGGVGEGGGMSDGGDHGSGHNMGSCVSDRTQGDGYRAVDRLRLSSDVRLSDHCHLGWSHVHLGKQHRSHRRGDCHRTQHTQNNLHKRIM